MNPAEPVTRILQRAAPGMQFHTSYEDLARGDPQLPVCAVGRREKEHVGIREHGLDRDERRIGHVGIGAEHLPRLQGEEVAQLVAQRIARVVALGLEGHPENAHDPVREIEIALREVDQARGQSFVDQHRGMPERERIAAEGRQLHRVFEQTRPGREPGAGHSLHARIVVPAAVQDAIEVQAVLAGDRVELVDDGELDVAAGVRHQLAELGFHRRHFDELVGEPPEELAHRQERVGIEGAQDLRQLPDLPEAMALGHPFRTERHADVEAPGLEVLLDVLADARKDGAPEDQDLAVAKVVRAGVDRPIHAREARRQVLIDRSADDEHEETALAHLLGGLADVEETLVEDLPEQLRRPVFGERHDAAADRLDRPGVGVVDESLEPRGREGQRERETDVAPSPDHTDFSRESRHGRHGLSVKHPGRPDSADRDAPVRGSKGSARAHSSARSRRRRRGRNRSPNSAAPYSPVGRGHRTIASGRVRRRSSSS